MTKDLSARIKALVSKSENKAQELLIANQRIEYLEKKLANADGPDESVETQIAFINQVANSRTKFAKEAQELLDSINQEG